MMDYSHKPGVVHAELFLPVRAPPEFSDRAALWNSVERTEKQWNSQLARRIIIALPKELSHEENIRLVRQYCQEQFVNKGMCCDFAIHDEGDGNPHAHILLTMRALDENGKWLPKARKVYDLDENGERIRLPSGNWKSHKENTVDWNEQSKAELWRHEWEVLQNKYLEAAGRSERIDMRSYERQGVELAPTVHMGPAVTNLERRGVHTVTGDLNRDIARENHLLQALQDWLNELVDLAAALVRRLSEPENVTLKRLLLQAYGQRDEEHQGWDASSTTRLKASSKDWNRIQSLITQMEKRRILTPVDLKNDLENLTQHAANLRHNLRVREDTALEAKATKNYLSAQKEHDSIFGKYSSIFFKKAKEKYYQEHKKGIDRYRRAHRFLEEHPELNTEQKLLRFMEQMEAENAHSQELLTQIENLAKADEQVLRLINAALPEGEQVTVIPPATSKSKKLLPEPILRRPDSKKAHQQHQPEPPKQPEPPVQPPKQSIRNRLKEAQQRKLDEQRQMNERRSEHEQTTEPNRRKKSYEQDL